MFIILTHYFIFLFIILFIFLKNSTKILKFMISYCLWNQFYLIFIFYIQILNLHLGVKMPIFTVLF